MLPKTSKTNKKNGLVLLLDLVVVILLLKRETGL
jgi:hypothetical protein